MIPAMFNPTRRLSMFKRIAAAIAAALILPSAAAAATITGVTGTPSSLSSSSLSVTWTLAPGESVCALYAGHSTDPTTETRITVDPAASSWSGGDGMAPGSVWRFVLRVGEGPSCANPSYSNLVEVDVAAYVAPAEVPVSPVVTPTSPTPVVTTPTVDPTTAAKIAELEARIKALEDRAGNLELAVVSAWQAFADALAAGADTAAAALTARSTALNSLYGLGEYAVPTSP